MRPRDQHHSQKQQIAKRRSAQGVNLRHRHGVAFGKRARGGNDPYQAQFVPPEDWHEPTGEASEGFRIIQQSPGPGYRHVVTEAEVRDRLALVPQQWLQQLDVVQLSRMTKKKKTFPCYGMQWGSALYLYPIEQDLVEFFSRPPTPAQYRDAKMYGGRWVHDGGAHWRLIWTRATVRDYYLNNILIHELGHLLDDRNTSYTDRERFADWFAIEHGYKSAERIAHKRKTVRRRHHSS